jgi:hypothetical protein
MCGAIEASVATDFRVDVPSDVFMRMPTPTVCSHMTELPMLGHHERQLLRVDAREFVVLLACARRPPPRV